MPARPASVRWAFFVGPDKAGSSWVQQVCEWHPEVCVPAAKDLYYFDRFYDRGADWYLSHFDAGRDTQVCLEVCHDYLYCDTAADRMKRDFPDATILVSLRDPVERAASAYMYLARQGRAPPDFSTALREVDHLVDHGRYWTHLEPYIQRFGRDRVALLDFDELRDDTASFARRLFRALDVAVVVPPAELLGPARPASRARNQLLASVGKDVADVLRELGLERIVGRLKRSATLEKLLFRRLGQDERVSVSPEDRRFVAEMLQADVQRLDAALGTDYRSRWFGDRTYP